MNHQPMRSIWHIFLVFTFFAVTVSACSESPIPLPFAPTPRPPNTLVYEAPVSLTIKIGTLLSGTSIAYQGKTETGQAKVLITGLLAPKQVADTVEWQGTPVPNVNLKLTTRVATFDEQSITLAGTARVEISNVTVQPGGASGTTQMEFTVPITFSLTKGETIPGTNIAYTGSATDGAQFSGLEGYPYRKQLDSLQYNGRLNPKVYVLLDLRVISYSDTGAVLGGTANIKIEQ